MRIQKSIQLAWNMLTNSKLRSWLTIIGIIIGIGAVIAIMAISEGAQVSLEASLGGLGADIMTITPGYSTASTRGGMRRLLESTSLDDEDQENLTKKDITVLKSIGNIKYVVGRVTESADIDYDGKSITRTVTGVETEDWHNIVIDELSQGRYLQKGDVNSVVIGDKLANEIFDGIELNRFIEIEGKQFKVIGILTEGSDIYMPIDRARDILEDVGDEEFDSINVQVSDPTMSEETMEEIIDRLMMLRGILKEDERDFTVTSMQDVQASINEMMETMTLFLSAIAAISLLVGAVGISNTMFTSVLEKTNEIGIMKAIGAKNKDIMRIFLFNSGMIGFVGGIGGVIVGSLAAMLIGGSSSGTASRGVTGSLLNSGAIITWELIVGAFLFSIIIGMIAGAIPAYRASRLKPVDALRYE
ncbi:ABC transporter permease [Candidatus Pacearchaeota archaeon]|nr:ABC transporter permease [Candidatus Pacearchaeota archaeon]